MICCCLCRSSVSFPAMPSSAGTTLLLMSQWFQSIRSSKNKFYFSSVKLSSGDAPFYHVSNDMLHVISACLLHVICTSFASWPLRRTCGAVGRTYKSRIAPFSAIITIIITVVFHGAQVGRSEGPVRRD